MDLKLYQRRVVDEVERYLVKLAEHQAAKARHPAQDAWEDLHLGRYQERKNGLGDDLPSFCIKVPTGGGKTLLATQALGSIYRTILKDRLGAGLVLWVVPSSQIYRDTLRRLKDRRDLYRVMLEHALSRRIEVWEKHEIARLSPVRLRDCLNILVVQLASTNRETKEQLKFFKDSGGNIALHFPPEDDSEKQKALKERIPNLDMIEDDAATGRHLAATSIGNLVRLWKPAVILDEGHKATSDLARRTIEGFNASVVVELSATPHKGANIVSRVSGAELLQEEMIKLPLNIATSGQKSWRDVLTQARDKRESLAKKATDYATAVAGNPLIRPIVLVQVQRTGKDQVDAGLIHSEAVKAYLIERLNVPEQAIAIKSSEKDDIEDLDLLDEGCPIHWIITKSALQEGWDCPFAYILVSLNETGSGQSMTQLVGRILRQPNQQRTPIDDLNESYVYCLHKRASEIAKEVKTALEKEGYEGSLASIVRDASDGKAKTERTTSIRQHFLQMHREPFEGKIYLPHFCVMEEEIVAGTLRVPSAASKKTADGTRRVPATYAPLDYFEHLIREVNANEFEYQRIDWQLAEEMAAAKDRFYKLQLEQGLSRVYETDADWWESDAQVKGWLAASLPFEYLSHKQVRTVVERVYERLCQIELNGMVKDRYALVKFVVREKIQHFIQEQVDRQTEAAFAALHNEGKLLFYLQCAKCRFEIPNSITIKSTGQIQPLTRDNGSPMERSLFDFIEQSSVNVLERAVAVCIDEHPEVLWWYRNLVGKDQFAIQGYRQQRIRPDFVVQSETKGHKEHQVLVLESKGPQLEGNPDTMYKRKVADYFELVGTKVSWQQLGEDFKDHMFRFQVLDQRQEDGRDWKDELRRLLSRGEPVAN
jgi:type III restriction enzyme